jgi:hypothetical protein
MIKEKEIVINNFEKTLKEEDCRQWADWKTNYLRWNYLLENK